MTPVLLTINAIVCVALVILILLQRSDPGAGGAFGGGGANSPVIRNPLARPTALLAATFLILSVVIAYTTKGGGESHSVMATGHAAETPAPATELPAPTTAGAADLLGALQTSATVAPAAVEASATETVSGTAK